MRIACPGCKAEFNIDDSRVPAGGLHLKCPKCAALFAVKKDAAARPPPPLPPPGAVPLPGGAPDAVPTGAVPLPGGAPGAAPTSAVPLPGGAPDAVPTGAVPLPARAPGVPPPVLAPSGAVPLPGFAGAAPVSPGGVPIAPLPGSVPVPLPSTTPGQAPPPTGNTPVPLPRPPFVHPPSPFDAFSFDAGQATVVVAPPPPPEPTREFHGSFSSTGQVEAEAGLEFDPTAATEAPFRPAPSNDLPPFAPPPFPPPAPPAPGGTDPELELLDFIDGAGPGATPLPPPTGEGLDGERFTIRRKSGKVFGPFEASTVVTMLSQGQLLGNEEVAADGAAFQPIGAIPAFARAIEELVEAPGGPLRGPIALEGGSRPEPPTLFGGRMAAPGAMHEQKDLGETLAAKVVAAKEHLPPSWRNRNKTLIAGGVVLLLLVIGLVMEAATPYGFLFRRPIFGLPGADGDSPLARLLEQSKGLLEADNYAASRKALETAETALKAEPGDPHARARYALAVYALERRYGGHAPQVERAAGYLAQLAPAGAREPVVLKALAAKALLEKNPGEARGQLDEVLGREPDDREALAMSVEALLLAKDAKGALARAEKLVALEPNGAFALHARGLAKRAADPEGAATDFEAALAADPRHTSSAVELADLALRVRRDRSAAARHVARALGPDGFDGLGGAELARAWAIQGTLKALDHKPLEARQAFDAALQASPGSLPARIAYGAFLNDRRQHESAVETLRPAFEAAPNDVAVVRSWVEAQLGVGRYLEAAKIADRLAGARPKDAAALVLQGEVQLLTGKPAEAEKAFAAAAEKAPDAAAPLVALGRHHLSQGKLDLARDELTRAVEKEPAEPSTHTGLGEMHLAAGALPEAIASFDAALAADPGHAPAHLGRGGVLEAKGDFAGALAAYEAAVTINDVVPVHRHRLGLLLWKMAEADGAIAAGELDRALAELGEAVKLAPKNARVIAHLGAVQLRAGKLDEALATLQNAVNVDATDGEANLWLARAALEKRDMPLANEAIRAAIRIDPENAGYHYQQGLIFEAGANPVDALDAYRTAVKLAPKDADGLERLGNAQVLLQALSDAAKSFEAALAVDPDRTRLLVSLGDVHFKAGQLDRAIARFQQAIKKDPALPGVHAKLAQAYDEKGDRRRAEAAYRESIARDPGTAVAYRQLAYALKERNQNGEAIRLFRKYLELAPEAADKADVEDEVATLLSY